jgi:MFS family permease
MTGRPGPHPGRAIAIAIAATTVVALPTLLVGGLAILVQAELGFGETELGIVIAVAFGTAALVAVPMGRLADHRGPRWTSRLGLSLGGVALIGIALLVDSWVLLAVFLGLAGAGITSVQLGVNVLLARSVPPARQGIAFGAKQAAVPLASLIAGLALPIVGLTIGWRAAFLMAALAVPFVVWRMPDAPSSRSPDDPTGSARPLPRAELLFMTLGVALASAGGNSTPAFVVPSLVDGGMAPTQAGLMLAGGSIVGVIVRVVGGWLGDRLGRGALLLIAALVFAGAIGYVGLALSDHPVVVAVCVALAFGGGWGWGGLMILALARISPDAPGRAMGIVQVGPMAGAVLGPLAFGTLAEHVAFGIAWGVMAVFAVLGATTIVISRARLVRRRHQGP